MSKKIMALAVGINDYQAPVPPLYGCLNDVSHICDFLKDRYGNNLHLEVLKDHEATRGNIINMFRNHLGKAGENDVAFFHYSGHGSRGVSAPQFKEFFPDEKDETLVCYDSRLPGGFDLADKELAVLLWELARNKPHIAVNLDCCHSGSATRTIDDFKLGPSRMTRQQWQDGAHRPLETYIDEYYKKQEQISIPRSRHVLMAACGRTETAKERNDRRGVYSAVLMDVLARSGGNISYADLFTICRSVVLKLACQQTPQFEPYEHFLPYAKFLDGERIGAATTYHVSYKDNEWKMDGGALHGLPTEPDKKIEVAVYPYDSREPAGFAQTLSVGTRKSTLKLAFEADERDEFKAEVTSLPVPPLLVYLEGEETVKEQFKKALEPGINLALTEEREGAVYMLSVDSKQCVLKRTATGNAIYDVQAPPAESGPIMLSEMEKVIRWERTLALQNHGTTFKPGDIQFNLFETAGDGKPFKHEGEEVTLDLVGSGGDAGVIRAKVRACNLTGQTLYFALVYLSEMFGIYILNNNPVPPGEDYVTLWGDNEEDYFHLPEDSNEAVDTFKLIVSTEPVDAFLLEQEELGATRAIGNVKPVKKLIKNDWFTKTITVRTVRRLNSVSERDLTIAGGRITIKGHSSFKANMSMAGGVSHTRGAEQSMIGGVMQGEGMEWLHFAPTRGGEQQGILELTDIENEESLKDHPLEILLDAGLTEDEYALPLTFDGVHFLPVGQPSKDETGKLSVLIDHVPEVRDENRRSLGKALKLCFFKFMKRKDIRQLRWVEYKEDGEIERRREGLKEKVAEAGNIILLVHGIIGDTEPIAKGLKLAGDENGASLAHRYGLVLTFDYENLNTPISETAQHLKAQLKEVGLHENQDKKITILAHSMGGLVSRWFIEQEGGGKIVKHLVMAGTPNNGSAFAGFLEYRNLAVTTLTLSLNFLKSLIPFAGGLLFALNQSKKVTHTLEQMNEKSPFIRELNISDDPNVRYSILSGDITHYDIDEQGFFSRLMEKLKTGLGHLVYSGVANDIAVSGESIKTVDDSRLPSPQKIDLSCHHLNYFSEAVSLDALAEVLG
jgi:pimeloyl-ACP methyl ester carboxylesterase